MARNFNSIPKRPLPRAVTAAVAGTALLLTGCSAVDKSGGQPTATKTIYIAGPQPSTTPTAESPTPTVPEKPKATPVDCNFDVTPSSRTILKVACKAYLNDDLELIGLDQRGGVHLFDMLGGALSENSMPPAGKIKRTLNSGNCGVAEYRAFGVVLSHRYGMQPVADKSASSAGFPKAYPVVALMEAANYPELATTSTHRMTAPVLGPYGNMFGKATNDCHQNAFNDELPPLGTATPD